MGHEIYRASDFDILPLNPNVNVLNVQHPVEAHLLALLKSHLDTGVFYFSYGWDMSRRLQAQWENLSSDAEKGLWEVVRGFAPKLVGWCTDEYRPMTGSFGTSDSSFMLVSF